MAKEIRLDKEEFESMVKMVKAALKVLEKKEEKESISHGQ